MNIKTITIALTVLVFAVLATVLMQKGSYVSQTQEYYEKSTGNTFKGASRIVEFVNTSIETNRTLWALTCDAAQNVKTAKQMAELESKYFPGNKGTTNTKEQYRLFKATEAYYIVSNYAKVETDKKTKVTTLAGLTSINVDALLGNVALKKAEEDAEEEGEEE
ncbi:MAG: hypothetical protein HUK21_02965 [Fibrobacteraceae bacterium]|nr:hypothetical protein [Fibrobacteraceae bacterium]